MLKKKKKSYRFLFFLGITNKAHELPFLSDIFSILLLKFYVKKDCLGPAYLK